MSNISQIEIINYRSIEKATFDSIENVTAFIGPNSSGKSSALYALQWFFEDTDWSNDNVNINTQEDSEKSVSVSVAVKFNLTGANNLEFLSSKNKFIYIKRTIIIDIKSTSKPKPSFLEYKTSENEDWIKSDDLETFLSEKYTFLLIPAQIDKNGVESDSILNKFLSAIPSLPDTPSWKEGERENYENKLKDESYKLISPVFNEMLPNHNFDISTKASMPTKAKITWSFNVVMPNGHKRPLSYEGDGFIRSLIISSLLAIENSNKKHIIVAIEEPELYQHPIRAKELASKLQSWAEKENYQVIYATHSQYFIPKYNISSTLIFSLNDKNNTSVTYLSVKSIKPNGGKKATEHYRKRVQKYLHVGLMNRFAEVLFAKGVILVEGESDASIIRGLISHKNHDGFLEEKGILILPVGGAPDFPLTIDIIKSIGKPYYIVADGDYREGLDQDKINSYKNSYSTISSYIDLGDNHSWGSETKITSDFTYFKKDIEDELLGEPNFIKEWVNCYPNYSKIKDNLQHVKDALSNKKINKNPHTYYLVASNTKLTPNSNMENMIKEIENFCATVYK